MDPYADFADRYDLFTGDFGQYDPERREFFRSIFGHSRVRTVLDCACGTGSDLYLLHSLGYEATGSDISEAMLDMANKNLTGRDVRVALHRVDYRELPGYFPQRFDAVVCLGSSIAEMPDDTEALKAFGSMSAVLQDGGLLILSQGTSDKQWREKPRFMPTVNTRDLSRVLVIDYVDHAGRNARYHILDLFHGEQASEFKVWSRDLHLLFRDDQARLLQASGFRAVDFYGSYRCDPYDKETSTRLIAVAHK